MKKIVLCALVSTVAISCTTVDPYSGETKTSNAAKGAGLGALAGAAIGAITSDNRREGALRGAVAGGAIGGGVGYYMDRQEAALRERLAGSGVQVQREGDNIRLVMPGNITFATGKYDIRSDFYRVLDSVALVLKEFNKTAIEVAGHTDSTGSQSTNQRLSEQRAGSVKAYLQGRQVSSGRIRAIGFGPRYPVASNQTSAGREANRRVELQLQPLES